MSAATTNSSPMTDAHRAFVAALGRIDDTLRYQFRRWPRDRREEAIAEARAYTWAAWLGLLGRGRDPIAVGVIAIAANCCRAVKNGRTVAAGRPAGRGARLGRAPQPVLLDRSKERGRGILGDADPAVRRSDFVRRLPGVRDGRLCGW